MNIPSANRIHFTALSAIAAVVIACGGAAPAGTAQPGGSTPSVASVPTPLATLPTPVAALPTPIAALPTQPGAPQGQAFDACSLLSDAEVEQITGGSVATRTDAPVQGIYDNGCAWELEKVPGEVAGWSIELGVIAPGGRDFYDDVLSPYAAGPVPGIGDVASEGQACEIVAVKVDSLVSVFVIAFGTADEDKLTRDLTLAAISHVP